MVVYPKISIVTPSFNDARFLERTILSVIGQNYPNLEYILIDGGSTDDSVEIIRKHEKHITYWESEKDDGMYFAIQKGFERSTGDIMGWINSDDKLQPGSLFSIAQVFSDYPEVQWVQGFPTVIDETDRIFVHPHTEKLDKLFFHRKKHAETGIFIQQESTFWKRSLWLKAGGSMSLKYKYAGDFDLWMRFFLHDHLYQLNAVLGSFRQTQGEQASKDNFQQYLEETFQILDSFPLSGSEKRHLRILGTLEVAERCFKRIHRMFLRKFDSSVIVGRIFFEPDAQKLKKGHRF